MNTQELIKKVKRIEIKTQRLTNNLFMGEYHSSFKGRGMMFSEVRPYQYGDDVRNIDWNKTAHFNEPYVKIFEEERELTVMLMVDISASQNYGTRKQLKKDTVAEICATLAFSALTNNDKVGLMLYADEVELYLPPAKGKTHILRIIRELVEYTPQKKKSNLDAALDFLLRVQKRKNIVFVLSDFLEPLSGKNLKIAAKKHDLSALRVYDEKEVTLPNVGLVTFEDNETGALKTINTRSAKVRAEYAKYFETLRQDFLNACTKSGVGAIEIRADEDYVRALLGYFKKHQKA